MRTSNVLGNLLWLIFGGFFSGIGYLLGGLLLCLTIVGIPFGIQCFKLGVFMFAPFGYKVVSDSNDSGCLTVFLNVVWLLFAGLGLAIGHLIWGGILYITILGIPFGRQHFKMVEVALMPFGKKVVSAD